MRWSRAASNKRLATAIVFAGCAGIGISTTWHTRGSGHRVEHGSTRLTIRPQELTVVAEENDRNRDFSLEVENTGATRVALTEVKTTCGCSVANGFRKQDLLAGESVSITISAHMPTTGDRDVRISVLTDSVAEPVVSAIAHLKGPVERLPRLEIGPVDLDVLGLFDREFNREVTLLTIERANSEPWIATIDSDVDWVHCGAPVIEELTDNRAGPFQRSYTFGIRGRFGSERSEHRRAVLRVRDAQQTTIASFVVAARATPAVVAIPKAACFNISSVDGTQTRDIVLRAAEPGFNLTTEVLPQRNSWLSIHQVSGDAKNMHIIRCTIQWGNLESEAKSHIIETFFEVQTNCSDMPVVTVPVYVQCRR